MATQFTYWLKLHKYILDEELRKISQSEVLLSSAGPLLYTILSIFRSTMFYTRSYPKDGHGKDKQK